MKGDKLTLTIELDYIINTYPGIVNSYVALKNQNISENGAVIKDVLIRLWVTDEFDNYNVMQLLSEDTSLKCEVDSYCDKFNINPEYDIINV